MGDRKERIQRRRSRTKGKKEQVRRILKEARTKAHGSPSRPMIRTRQPQPAFEQVYEEFTRQQEAGR